MLRLAVFTVIACILPSAVSAWESTRELEAPDGTVVTISRDDYGVPHIAGETEAGVFYGQGFAVARDRLYQMEINRRAAKGRLAEMLGPGYVGSDQSTRSLSYTEAERIQQFGQLSAELQEMITSYVAGVNAYLDSMAVDPATYRPLALADFAVEDWTATDIVAVIQHQMRRFGAFGGEELQRLYELDTYGQDWFDQYRPINDPAAPTTIPGGRLKKRETGARWSGPAVRPAVIQEILQRQEEHRRLELEAGLPPKFGSFAVGVTPEKSAGGNVMHLGCPQMGEPQLDETNAVNEVELDCPTLHVGGMTVAGIPGVIIGHNENVAWTLTSGISDNTDVYIETTQDASLSYYWHDGQWEPFTAIADTVYDDSGTPHPFTIHRSVHGPVFGDDLASHQAYTYKMAFWDMELDLIQAEHLMTHAAGVDEFEAALPLFPVSFNVLYAGADQRLRYRHVGRYQDRSDGVDPRLPHNGDGTEEWGGIIPFDQLPAAADPGQGYFANWNNKPVIWWDNGDNVPWVGWHPVVWIANYVEGTDPFGYAELKAVPQTIGSHGTYQQAVELGAHRIIDENLVPPGQSAFVSLEGEPDPHVDDQWPLHVAWDYKDMLFGLEPAAAPPAAGRWRTLQLRSRPSPAAGAVLLELHLSRAQSVRVTIFDPAGRAVRDLWRGPLSAGPHIIDWDGLDSHGRRSSPGMYYCRVSGAGESVSTKVIRLR
ncbi:MAG: hypothetical protein GF355_04305 [Candidatus Eisenbacteria bacterium]|nr:hypothetical protein [Candidatus Eisenbacteria bacterium]